jgi:hypothetical protein
LVRLAMPKGLRRRYGLSHLHFITCSCYRRLPLFASASAKNLFCEASGRSARPPRVRARGLCRHAGTHSPAHQLAGEGHSFHRHAVLEAARLAAVPPQATQKSVLPTTQTSFPTRARFLTPILAASLLRYQRLEPDKGRRETPIHAHESLEKKIGRTSKGLALEQFLILREEGIRAGSHRSHALM